MLEAEQPIKPLTKDLETLLSRAKLNERRARKRAVLYTIIPLALGAAFLGVSLYKVLRLEQRATSLNQQITAQISNLNKSQKELAELEERKKSLEYDLEVATKTLTDIDKGAGDPQQKARTALRLISPDSKISSSDPTTRSTLTVVPNLIGKSFEKAFFEIPRSNLRYVGQLQDWKATVRRQDPVPGSKVPRGAEVHLWVESDVVSPDPTAKGIDVPDFRGKTYLEALHYLDLYKLRFEGNIPPKTSTVIKQDPLPGTKVTVGSKIHLWFGPALVSSP